MNTLQPFPVLFKLSRNL